MDSAAMPHIHLSTPAAPAVQQSGVDPALFALMGSNNGGMFGGNSLLPLLIGAFLFGGSRGLWGVGGAGPGGAGAFAAEAVAAQSIFTPKDTAAQLNTFQSWAQTNAAALAQQCCCSTQQIIAAIKDLSPQMFQQFAAMSQANMAAFGQIGAAISSGVNGLEKSLDAGFAAGQLAECQTQNLVNATKADSDFKNASQFCALAKQLAECCCENRLAIANQNALIERNTAAIQNQIAMQTCEIKQAIAAGDEATRALIRQNETDRLRQELDDAKAQLTACQNSRVLNDAVANSTATLAALIQTKLPCGVPCPKNA